MGSELGGADVIPAENGKIKGMIRAAGIGIAIGNAMPEVKKAADYVAKAIDDGGLADAVSSAVYFSRNFSFSPKAVLYGKSFYYQ